MHDDTTYCVRHSLTTLNQQAAELGNQGRCNMSCAFPEMKRTYRRMMMARSVLIMADLPFPLAVLAVRRSSNISESGIMVDLRHVGRFSQVATRAPWWLSREVAV